jgi:hypothetical protein
MADEFLVVWVIFPKRLEIKRFQDETEEHGAVLAPGFWYIILSSLQV